MRLRCLPMVLGVGALLLARGAAASAPKPPAGRLIVIGFTGGNVRPDDMAHGGVREAHSLERRFPGRIAAAVFSNHDPDGALHRVLALLGAGANGQLSAREKENARIVLYGTSWGASEAVTLARRLNEMGIPVLLTIQIDSVEKRHEDDRDIPPNIHAALNLYQTHGIIHGRSTIVAMDPKRTAILGNIEEDYRNHPIATPGYAWVARTFTRPHIEIENDPAVWARVDSTIVSLLR